MLKGKVHKYGADVNTDVIIPARYLSLSEPAELAKHCMEDIDKDFVKRVQPGDIMMATTNFGCGSSREHAPWALDNYGFRCIIAPSFADIFYSNCINNGILPITLPDDVMDGLFKEVEATEGYTLSVDLAAQTLTRPDGETIDFEIESFLKERLLNGWDQIGLTLSHEDKIAAYEASSS